tara:strand:+ start:920 stop:1081 length:162 start_codon:yes stop_codon:yes gene_type:complete
VRKLKYFLAIFFILLIGCANKRPIEQPVKYQVPDYDLPEDDELDDLPEAGEIK